MSETLQTTKCSSCGAEIAFITSANTGKAIPIDLVRRSIVTLRGETVVGYESHFSSCPNAAAHRNQGRGRR